MSMGDSPNSAFETMSSRAGVERPEATSPDRHVRAERVEVRGLEQFVCQRQVKHPCRLINQRRHIHKGRRAIGGTASNE
jgi:hypothetical protein